MPLKQSNVTYTKNFIIFFTTIELVKFLLVFIWTYLWQSDTIFFYLQLTICHINGWKFFCKFFVSLSQIWIKCNYLIFLLYIYIYIFFFFYHSHFSALTFSHLFYSIVEIESCFLQFWISIIESNYIRCNTQVLHLISIPFSLKQPV